MWPRSVLGSSIILVSPQLRLDTSVFPVIALTALGATIGYNSTHRLWQVVGYAAGFTVGLVGGGAASTLLQWLVLRRLAMWAGWWVVASLVGLGWGVSARMSIGLASVMTVDIVIDCTALGVSVGTLQWLVLRQRFSHAGWWVAASILGWIVGIPLGRVVGMTVGFPAAMVASMVTGGAVGGQAGFVITVIAGFAAAGAAIGAVTGRALLWLLRQPVADV